MSRGAAIEPALAGRRPRWTAGKLLALLRSLFLVVLAAVALSTPGFLSIASITSLLTTASFLGCLAAAMTFVTLSGNVMSFALGGAAAASALVFVPALNVWGLAPALLVAAACGIAITGIQGVLVGAIRANPIITSIAANVLIYGVGKWVTDNATAHVTPEAARWLPSGAVAGLPVEFVAFVLVCGIGQVLLSLTVFGRHLLLVGSGPRAAEAAGLPVVSTTAGAYCMAGLFAALTGVLLAARYGQANLDVALHGDYDAIAAVLVGGNAIEGGSGSMLRSAMGVLALSVLDVVLLLYGLPEEWRFLATGAVVLIVLVLYSKQRHD